MSNIRRFGDWKKAQNMSNNLKKDINHANTVALKQIGLKTERLVVKYIQSQPKTWPPLSEDYLRRKERQGDSNLMLRKSGTYINSIRSSVEEPKKLVFVGVKKEAVSDEGEVLANIGAVLEYGSEKINVKPRPHFEPVKKQMLRKIKTEKLFTNYLNNELRRKYGIK